MRQERKRSPKDGKTQKMFSFRIDLDLVDYLDSQPNKGRYLNNLIRMDKGGSGG